MAERLLTGWGRTTPSRARNRPCDDTGEVAGALGRAGPRGALARGLGRSYGDAALNGGGDVLALEAGLTGVRLDPDTGVVTAGGGASLDTVLRRIVPAGWFVPVSPGTRYVTVGGWVAADVHGKNHHRDGSVGNHLLGIELVTPDGAVHDLGPDRDPAAFWATVGGMGLTGVITLVRFQAVPIGSSRLAVDTRRADDLDGIMALMAATDHEAHYSVAWIDLVATGSQLGRSVLTTGDFAPADALAAAHRRDPWAYDPTTALAAPPWAPSQLLNRLTIRAFNELWFRKAPRDRRGELQTIPTFFHPLDGVTGWNRLYGNRGFLQYQFVVPFGAEAVLRSIVERLAGSAVAPSFLAVLKRFGAANAAPLSFPMPGWTLTLDIPAVGGGVLAALLDQLDELVVGAGGRLYLAKDSRMAPALLERTYPRLGEWRAVRDRLDPGRVLCSDLDRRLDLTGRRTP
ncbi:MAG: FAD-binding protein [Acidimicrobiales bacterium]